jgi:hypothetical protein
LTSHKEAIEGCLFKKDPEYFREYGPPAKPRIWQKLTAEAELTERELEEIKKEFQAEH